MNSLDNGYVYIVHAWYTDQKSQPDDQTAYGFFFTELEAKMYQQKLIEDEKRFADGAPFKTVIHQYERS